MKAKPSTLDQEDVFWLVVRATGKKEHESVYGKWLIFRLPNAIDDVWEKIVQATRDNLLGPASKVSTKYSREASPHSDGTNHVICVYCNKAYIKEVLIGLRSIGILERLYFKTEDATHEGKYGNKSWKFASEDFGL